MKSLLLILLLSLSVSAQYSTSVASSQSEYGDWNFHYLPFDVNGEAQQNHVVRFGWNCAAGGGQLLPGISAVCLEFESHYRPFGSTGPEWQEIHLAGTTRSGYTSRGLSFMFDENTGNWTTVIRSGNLNFLNEVGDVNLQMFSGGFILQSNATIRSIHNNQDWLWQYKSGGGKMPLIRANASNRVLLGGGAYPTEIGVLYLKDGTMKVVSFAGADSCGSGFKCLRVVN